MPATCRRKLWHEPDSTTKKRRRGAHRAAADHPLRAALGVDAHRRPAGEGTLFTFGPDPRNKPTAKAIVEKFKANNIDPEGYTLYTYAALQVWSQAVAKAGTTDPKKVMAAIKAGSWDTVIGKMEFDAKGDIKQLDYVVYKWDAKGNYTEINPKGS